ncbi:MAG: bifunctional diaminohydroxyphosphoribosylaminopyrimidine deaminase/5-amino-6-(5-phosphoribosylamino)uracil reductase RibD [Acidobacteriales bacterium]|nr:bifunctional diaminohydroxyphosphoribosylaminopyrimidine deaminase/5-amino-6-(5-phosphoribosylamino)uracil reductase RibD [Terriglobales bacterium]
MPGVTATDENFLRRAVALAREGIGLTSPNPCVGAVIVTQNGEVAGEGSHTWDGVKHAEVLAIEQAGERARGATLYINLEPCSHHGRTGPCTEAVIAAGIKRAVISMADPNPVNAGRGFDLLRAAGLQVDVGGLADEARHLNEAFAKYIRTRTPLVTLKSAMTLDGKIAAPQTKREGTSASYITGDQARAHVQQLRHASDAILVGIGTALADDPLLTDRSGLPRRRPLLRVILDSRLNIPLGSKLVSSVHDDLLVLFSEANPDAQENLRARGVRLQQVSRGPNGRTDLQAAMRFLGEQQIASVLIEGGAAVNAAALAAGIVDKIFFYYTPRILGGRESIPFAAGDGFPSMSSAPHVQQLRIHQFGEDFAVEGYLRDPYAD